MDLQKGQKYKIVSGSDFFRLCESLRHSQDNDRNIIHPAYFRLQAREGSKSIFDVFVVVYNLRMVDGSRVEVLGPQIGLSGVHECQVKVIYNPWERGLGGESLEVL